MAKRYTVEAFYNDKNGSHALDWITWVGADNYTEAQAYADEWLIDELIKDGINIAEMDSYSAMVSVDDVVF